MTRVVAYYRPLQPSVANLDLDAQRQCVRNYARDIHSDIAAEFTEHVVTKKDTPELMKALRVCECRSP
jgi:hypothetical protein